MGDFEKSMKDLVVIHAERFVLVEYIKKHKINDYEKIKAVERFTGVPMN